MGVWGDLLVRASKVGEGMGALSLVFSSSLGVPGSLPVLGSSKTVSLKMTISASLRMIKDSFRFRWDDGDYIILTVIYQGVWRKW